MIAELDRAVFERFFGYRVIHAGRQILTGDELPDEIADVWEVRDRQDRVHGGVSTPTLDLTPDQALEKLMPAYSSSVHSAWPVVEELRRRGWRVEFHLPESDAGLPCLVWATKGISARSRESAEVGEAICRVALMTTSESSVLALEEDNGLP